MSHKTYIQLSAVALLLFALLATPLRARAGSACGSTYTVQPGDTLGSVSATCEVTAYDLYNANPGVGYFLNAGQVLSIPNGTDTYNNYSGYNNYNGYNGNPYNYNYVPASTGGTYVVQVGDTFGEVASRYGVSVNQLWSLNPSIANIDLLYPGQVLNVPSSAYAATAPPTWYGSQPASPWHGSYPPPSWYSITPTPTAVPTPLSYGTVPAGSPMANIELSNKANAQVYVSLQGTARDGTSIVREYPVYGTFTKEIPAGFYYYSAWVGGQEFSGAINLPGGSSHSLVFHRNEVDAQ